MPTSSSDSPRQWPRCQPSELARQRAGLKAMHEGGHLRFASEEAAGTYDKEPLASQPPPPVKGPVTGSYMTLRERAAQQREEA